MNSKKDLGITLILTIKCLLFLLFIPLISACSKSDLKVPDISVCAEISKVSGTCFTTVSNINTDFFDQDWDSLKNESYILPFKSWSKIKVFILDACVETKGCDRSKMEEKVQRIELNLSFQKIE